MPSIPQPSISSSEPASARLAEIIESFEAAWKGGRKPELDAYLPDTVQVPQLVLVELVRADLECRIKSGETFRLEDYLQHYPDLIEDPSGFIDLIVHEYQLRLQHEPDLSLDEFRRRFPELAGDLASRVPKPPVIENTKVDG